MKLREWKKMLAGAAVLVLAAAPSPAEAAVSVDPVPGMTDSFIRGADVSMLPDLEKAGVKFYDMDGTQMDELAIMKNMESTGFVCVSGTIRVRAAEAAR